MMLVVLLILFSLMQIYIGAWTLSFLQGDKENFQFKVEHIILSLLIGMGIETLLFLFLDILFIPLIGVFISFVLVYFYPIDREFHKKLIDEINLRKLKNV